MLDELLVHKGLFDGFLFKVLGDLLDVKRFLK